MKRPTLPRCTLCGCHFSYPFRYATRLRSSPSSREEAHHMNPYRNRRVSSSLSKIPYGGFSPVRLQTGIQSRPSSKMSSLSERPAFTLTNRIYTRPRPLSPKRAIFHNGTCVQAGLPLSYMDHPVQRSLAPRRVMLSHHIIAYCDLIRASLPLPPVYVLSSGQKNFISIQRRSSTLIFCMLDRIQQGFRTHRYSVDLHF
jgi:hypothetical protein